MLDDLLGAASFLPHGFCLLWRPDLVALHLVSDIAIGLAYFSIPLAILSFLRKRPDFEYRWVAYLFATFIVLCGTTHFAAVAMLWYPYYGLDGMVKAVTGVASVLTAMSLWPFLPKVVALPSPRLLEQTNQRLEAEIRERRAAEAELRLARDDLERRVAERTADLARSEERLRLALAAGRLTLWDWEIGTGRVICDEAHRQLFGIDRPEAGFTAEDFIGAVHPDDLPRVRQALMDALQPGAGFDTEFRIVRRDGRTLWLAGKAHTVFEEGRAIRMVGVNFDITERKDAEERQRLLMAELNHRVKNTLATVRSIARVTLTGHEDPKTAFAMLDGRFGALARTHEILAENMWKGASLTDLLLDEFAPYPREQIHLSGPDVVVNPRAAQTLTLCLHEMTTNAVKYGALSSAGGRLSVEWSISERDGLRLTWRETGGPAVVPPTRRGFGSTLLERSIRHELDGRATTAFEPGGFTCVIEAPFGRVHPLAADPP